MVFARQLHVPRLIQCEVSCSSHNSLSHTRLSIDIYIGFHKNRIADCSTPNLKHILKKEKERKSEREVDFYRQYARTWFKR